MNRIFDGNVRKAVTSFFMQTREMIKSQQPDIIGHLDKVIMNTADFFDENESWYQEEIDKTLDVIKQFEVIVEANTRGLYKGKWNDCFPSKAILKKCFALDIPVTISSDAHHSNELLLAYDKARTLLKSIGYKYLQGRKNGKWGNFPI
jgi:histidinol-phosphatase (PHP family)